MYCPSCKAAVEAHDAFCPKCGAGVTLQTRNRQAAGASAGTMTVAAGATQGQRAQSARVPIAEGGTKYPGLTRAAAFSIRLAVLTRILSYVFAALTAASIIMYLYPRTGDLWPVAIGAAAAIVVCFVGQMVALLLAVQGELIHVVMDVEEDIRLRP